MSSLSFHDKQHVLRLLNQQGQVKRIFDDFTRRSGLILTKWTEKNTDNVWVRNTSLEKQIDKLLEELHDNILININNNTTGAWEASNLKNDDLLKAFIKDLALPEIIGKSRYEKLEQGMFARNMEALKAFQQRTIDGLTLSDTVWKSVEGAKENLEFYLSSGISTGRPAASISQDIRQLLQDPDKRFRRVRNDEGKLIMSKPMQDYHPGQGRYRSSYMNALRTAATETNQAYHTADYERRQGLDFVLGIEVHRSKSNKGPCSICDPMVGKYPKDYKFIGNHPFCICFTTSIMLEGEEYIDYLLTGVVPEDKIIKTVPQSAIDFVNKKEANQNQWFVKENSRYLLNSKSNTPKVNKVRTDEEKAAIQQRWENRSVENFNQKRIEEKLNIKKGTAMDFEAANELRGNINFRKEPGYGINCQSCVVANELRRRGYDVTALPNLQKKGNIPYELSRKTEMAWFDKTTSQAPKKKRAGGPSGITSNGGVKSKPLSVLNKELDELTSEVGRYHIDFVWKGRKASGHIITMEKFTDGSIRLYDPQTGRLRDWPELSKQINLKYGVNVLKVDDLLINTDIIDSIVTKL